jgi:hypothetical protein
MSYHTVDHCYIDHGFAAFWEPFVILAELPILSEPGKRSFHDLSARKHLEPVLIFPFLDDLHRPAEGLLRPLHKGSRVTPIRPDPGETRQPVLHLLQKGLSSVSILNACGSDKHAQKVSLSVDEEVTLTAFYLPGDRPRGWGPPATN